MAQRYRPRPMPLSDEEFEKRMRAEEALDRNNGILGDGSSMNYGGDDWQPPMYTSKGPQGGNLSVGQAPRQLNEGGGGDLNELMGHFKKKKGEAAGTPQTEMQAQTPPGPEPARQPGVSGMGQATGMDGMAGGAGMAGNAMGMAEGASGMSGGSGGMTQGGGMSGGMTQGGGMAGGYVMSMVRNIMGSMLGGGEGGGMRVPRWTGGTENAPSGGAQGIPDMESGAARNQDGGFLKSPSGGNGGGQYGYPLPGGLGLAGSDPRRDGRRFGYPAGTMTQENYFSDESIRREDYAQKLPDFNHGYTYNPEVFLPPLSSGTGRKPLSDEDFTRRLYDEGSLSGEDMAQTDGARASKPLSDAEFGRRMAAEDAANGRNAGQRPQPLSDEEFGKRIAAEEAAREAAKQPYTMGDRMKGSMRQAPPHPKKENGGLQFGYDYEAEKQRMENLFKEGQARKYPVDTPVLRQGTVDDLKNTARHPVRLNYTIPDVVDSIPNNLIPSGKKFFGDLKDAVMHPGETRDNIKSIVKGFAGSEEHRPSSDAVRDKISERYGGWENIKRTVAEDPVGALGDASMGSTALGITARAGSLAAKAAGKAQGMGKQALSKGKTVAPGSFEKNATALSNKLNDASKHANGVAGKIDPVAAPMSALVKELQGMVENINSSQIAKYGTVAAKLAVPTSRINTATQAASTGNAIVKEDPKKKNK